MLAGHCRQWFQSTEGMAVVDLYANNRAAAARGRFEIHHTGMPDIGALHRMPRDPLAGQIVGDLGLPFNLGATGTIRDPMRTAVARAPHRLHVAHKARQVLEITPETV